MDFYGHSCTILTDNQALKSLLKTPQPSGKLARWGMSLQELDVTIEYRVGKSNGNADALSWNPASSPVQSPEGQEEDATLPQGDSTSVIQMLTPGQCDLNTSDNSVLSHSVDQEHLAQQQGIDPDFKPVMTYLRRRELPQDETKARKIVAESSLFELVDGVLYRSMPDKTLRTAVPATERRKLFSEVHEGTYGAHQREAKTHFLLSRHYWWPSMRQDIRRWSEACSTCFERRAGPKPHIPLTPIPVAGPWDRVGVDVLQLPRSNTGNRYLIVFVDYLTKWVEAFATPNQTSLTIARLLVEEVVSRHGVPNELLSDRGTNFLSRLMEEVYKLLGVKKVNSTSYHPQTDGLVERFHRTILDMMAKTSRRERKTWDERLPYLLFAYRATIQDSTQASPFRLLYGREARLPTTHVMEPQEPREVPEGYCEEFSQRMAAAWASARTNVEKAQQRQKRYHDKAKEATQFHEGEIVYVFMPSKTVGEERKLQLPHEGPFRITRLWPSGVEVVRLGRGRKRPIRVALERLRKCPPELIQAAGLEEVAEPTGEPENVVPEEMMNDTSHRDTTADKEGPGASENVPAGQWTTRLRPRVRKRNIDVRKLTVDVTGTLQPKGGGCNSACCLSLNGAHPLATPEQSNTSPLWFLWDLMEVA